MLQTEAEQWLEERGFPPPDGRADYMLRLSYINTFGFAIPSVEAVDALATLSPLVEVGAGSAYWAYEIQKAGGECVPTDPGAYRHRILYAGIAVWQPYTEMKRLTGVQAVRKYPSHTLLMVWPDYNKSWPSQTLAAYTGNIVAYVGEGSGGCTGDDQFHCILGTQFTVARLINIPSFPHIHDRLAVYKRNPASAKAPSSSFGSPKSRIGG